MDGLSAGTAIVASFGLIVVAELGGNQDAALVLAALAGASLGFLRYNFEPAKIYMGDCGSLFLGLMLGATAMNNAYTTTNRLAALAPALILGVPLFDMLFVMYVRRRRGLPVMLGSPDHVALRLRKWRFTTKQTVLLSYAATALLGVAALGICASSLTGATWILAGVGVAARRHRRLAQDDRHVPMIVILGGGLAGPGDRVFSRRHPAPRAGERRRPRRVVPLAIDRRIRLRLHRPSAPHARSARPGAPGHAVAGYVRGRRAPGVDPHARRDGPVPVPGEPSRAPGGDRRGLHPRRGRRAQGARSGRPGAELPRLVAGRAGARDQRSVHVPVQHEALPAGSESDDGRLGFLGRAAARTSRRSCAGRSGWVHARIGYNATFRYPKRGGIEVVPNAFAARIKSLRTGARVTGDRSRPTQAGLATRERPSRTTGWSRRSRFRPSFRSRSGAASTSAAAPGSTGRSSDA